MESFDIENVYGIVYMIKCKQNGKIYVGQTFSHIFLKNENRWVIKGMMKRFYEHYTDRAKYSDLHEDLHKYGMDEFEVTQLTKISGNAIDTADEEEYKFIELLKCKKPDGYNDVCIRPTCMGTKKLLLEHYGLQNKKMTTNQKHSEQIGFRKIPKNSKMKSAHVKPIKHNGIIKEVRVLLKDKDNTVFRKCFLNNEILESVNKAVKFAYESVEEDKVKIHPAIQDILDGEEGNEVYEYQEKLEELLVIDGIKSVNGTFQSYKTFSTFLLIFRYKNKKGSFEKRVSFGGKTIEPKEARKRAKKFVNKFEEQYNVEITKKLQTYEQKFGSVENR